MCVYVGVCVCACGNDAVIIRLLDIGLPSLIMHNAVCWSASQKRNTHIHTSTHTDARPEGNQSPTHLQTCFDPQAPDGYLSSLLSSPLQAVLLSLSVWEYLLESLSSPMLFSFPCWVNHRVRKCKDFLDITIACFTESCPWMQVYMFTCERERETWKAVHLQRTKLKLCCKLLYSSGSLFLSISYYSSNRCSIVQ